MTLASCFLPIASGAIIAYVLTLRAPTSRRERRWRLAESNRAENQRNPQPPSVRIREPLSKADESVESLHVLADVRAAADAHMSAINRPFCDLLERSFVPTSRKLSSTTTCSSDCALRFLQFNILARGLSSGPSFGGFVKSPVDCLDFHSFRKFRILEEILRFDPDVVAVEELDHFNDFMQPAMEKFGYDGIFQPKRRAPAFGVWDKMTEEDRHGQQPFLSDGCALFWKRDAVDGIFSGAIGYDSGREAEGKLWGQVGLYARLAPKGKENRTFLVAVTHLKSKPSPENEAQRVSQMSQLIARLEDVRHNPNEPVVVMGDFNTDPSLDLYNFVTGRNGHALDLESAYVLGGNGEEPPYTTCKERKNGVACHVIDYIMVPRSTKVRAVLSVPPVEELASGMLPNWNYPSDHLSIGADLELSL